MLQIDMPADFDLTFGVHPVINPYDNAITFQPGSENAFVSNTNNLDSLDKESILNIGLRELKSLMTQYETCLVNSDTPASQVASGGVQQFLNRLTMMKREHSDHHNEGCELQEKHFSDFEEQRRDTTAMDLPDDVLLHIFSFLNPKDMCRISTVSKRWHTLSHDELLWKHKLNHDVTSWNIIGHTTNPDMYRECESDWSSKEIYLRCSPEFNQMRQQEFLHFITLSSFIRSLLPRHAPKVAMFGPGLESETSNIFRKILWDKSGDFQRTALIPGFAGMGSGIAFRLRNKLDFNLFTLYSSTRQERESTKGLSGEQRLKKNKMLQHLDNVEAGEDDDDDQVKFELSHSLRKVSREMNAFVYVVNATTEVDISELKWSRHELFAMVNERWANPHVPLLVLTCTKDNATPRRPCIDIVKCLQLGKLCRPWQVHNCVVDELEGVANSLEWLLQRSKHS